MYKLGIGVYVKAEEFECMPCPKNISLCAIAGEAFIKLGIPYELGELERDYNNGSTQVQVTPTFEVYKRKITRKLKIGADVLFYENKLEKSTRE